ncbi:molybdopterin-dependent oxidoreductase [Pseudaminobacter salicylatoxidans]|uniref:molybdopterin-dependent oxidoreductase n=1 Tax=Pseudaminobacter salicylatoxidans TaxID=93369 RepID=UPI0002DF5486|nr:molybdopterin-dependent oxidoreductase [Pseudaminobacter salicylatoxidans]
MAIAFSAVLAVTVAYAGNLATPTGPVLLTITGKLGKTNHENGATFDDAMLAAFPQHRIETSTPWTDGVKLFEGVLLAELLDFVGIDDAQTLRAIALNEYEIVTPFSEAIEYGALLAMRMDGKPLTRRDKGPIWIVYPRDSNSRIQDEHHDSRWVWQLTRIEVQ